LAQCELHLEARMLADEADEMRFLYESSLLPPENPKG